MTERSSETLPPTASSTPRHPRALAPANLLLTVLLSVLGAIVGIQLLASLGITPSTSLLGAIVAMTLARIPLVVFRAYRSVHAQNLAQTSISSATFGAANSLFLPIGIPFVFGLPDMIVPMLVGVSCAMLLDAWLLYRMFDTPAFPAKNPWPLGIAAAETIRAGDEGGRRAVVLAGGFVTGVVGAIFALPMSAFGVALIGGLGAMIAFAVGLLSRAYSVDLIGVDLYAQYIPHGMMIGAGIVALVQVGRAVVGAYRSKDPVATRSATVGAPVSAAEDETQSAHRLGRSLAKGGVAYLVVAIGLSLGTGIVTDMGLLELIGFIAFATAAAFIHELIVGIAAMHSGWFPAFAVALITLLIGILIGFPPEALVVMAGFTAATGPAFADMGYDLKAGFVLRGNGVDPEFELEGRRQQFIAAMIGFVVAIAVVALSYQMFFDDGKTAPINAAYVASIQAGVSGDTARALLIWAIPGALLQLIGGPRQQLGILLATGLLILSPQAGWLVAAGLVVRVLVTRVFGTGVKEDLEVFAGGAIAGDALYSFGNGAYNSLRS